MNWSIWLPKMTCTQGHFGLRTHDSLTNQEDVVKLNEEGKESEESNEETAIGERP